MKFVTFDKGLCGKDSREPVLDGMRSEPDRSESLCLSLKLTVLNLASSLPCLLATCYAAVAAFQIKNFVQVRLLF